VQLSGNVFFRRSDIASFNGDGSEFEECDEDDPETTAVDERMLGVLCEEGEVKPITDQDDNNIAEEDNDMERNAINNRSTREQQSFGGTAQYSSRTELMGRENYFLFGSSYYKGEVDFISTVEIASLNDDRSTAGTGLFVPEEGTALEAETRTWSVYLSDTLEVVDRLDLTLSMRYNHTRIILEDRGDEATFTEENEDLNGTHTYARFNPAVGLTYAFRPTTSAYAGYSESSRAPTPVELACADEEAPCSLPNAFLADPPLEQVVARSLEFGLRGSMGPIESWSVGIFGVRNFDDIIFQSTGGAAANQGFFANVGDTQRIGGDIALAARWQRVGLGGNYSYVRATYEDEFTVRAIGDDDDELIPVNSGDRLPGIPSHTAKLWLDFYPIEELRLGLEGIYASERFLRGDETNQLDPIDSYFLLNVSGEYQPNPLVNIFFRVNNVLDTDYETFGLLGEAEEVAEILEFDEDDVSGRFLSPGAPTNFFAGIRLSIE